MKANGNFLLRVPNEPNFDLINSNRAIFDRFFAILEPIGPTLTHTLILECRAAVDPESESSQVRPSRPRQ